MFDPATTPALDGLARRRVFIAHIYRRPIAALYRDKPYTVCQSTPTVQRKMSIAGFTQEIPDLEIMIALDLGSEEPQPMGKDGVTIKNKEYRILSVQGDLGTDCYQFSLSLRNR